MLTRLFNDPEVERLRQAGNRLVCDSGRTLLLPDKLGFCNGVQRALKSVAEALSKAKPGRVWIVGEIIHNPTVNRCLQEAGARIVREEERESFWDCADCAKDRVVIPAFGIERGLELAIRRRFAPELIVDTTCGYVKRSWRLVEQAAADGYTVAVHGDPRHPEIRSTVSRVGGGRSAVVHLRTPQMARDFVRVLVDGAWRDWPADGIVNPGQLNRERLALISQTTLLEDDIREVAEILSEAMVQAGGRLLNASASCLATRERQAAALRLCRRGCDLSLVVGGYGSSNTRQLYRIARSYGAAFFIGDARNLDSSRITHFIPETGELRTTSDWLPPSTRRLGILAGASCPASDVGDLIRKLGRM